MQTLRKDVQWMRMDFMIFIGILVMTIMGWSESGPDLASSSGLWTCNLTSWVNQPDPFRCILRTFLGLFYLEMGWGFETGSGTGTGTSTSGLEAAGLDTWIN